MANHSIDKYFKLFPYLHEDARHSIVSFVADAPMETLPYLQSTLVTYRGVSKAFQKLCDSDVQWKEAFLRMINKEPSLFKNALRKLTNVDTHQAEVLLETAKETHLTYKNVYKIVLDEHLRFSGPVFVMPGVVPLGQTYALHLFERRYRIMIEQLMKDQPESAKNGGRITEPVYFIHANRAPLFTRVPALLVEVTQCRLREDGRADVVLLPVHHVSIEKLWVQEHSGHLYYAQALKMGRNLSAQMNYLQRQEALANVMDGLAAQLALESTSDEYSSSEYGSSGNGE